LIFVRAGVTAPGYNRRRAALQLLEVVVRQIEPVGMIDGQTDIHGGLESHRSKLVSGQKNGSI
jgi:hypothetical protein